MTQIPSDPYAGVKALFNEIQANNAAGVERLLKGEGCAAVSPSARDNLGQSAMTVAAYWNRPDIIRLLAAHGGDLNISDDHIRDTALIQAAINSRLETATVLLELGADPNRQNRYGHSALHISVHMMDEQMVEQLLKHGADPYQRNEGGETAFSLALDTGYEPMIKRLEDWQRDRDRQRLEDEKKRQEMEAARQKQRAERLARLDHLSSSSKRRRP